jgi:hypothetical protein
MSDQQSSRPSRIERRTFLKAATAASTGPLLARKATAKSTRYGKTRFTEAGITYEIEDPVTREKLPFLEVDEWLNHYVDVENDVLYFHEQYLEEARPILESGAPVVRFEDFTDKSVSRSMSPTETLPTSSGRSYRTTGALRLSKPHKFTRPSISVENNAAVVQSNNGETEVPSNTVATHALPSQEVTVEASEPIPAETEPIDVLLDGEPAPDTYRPTARRTWKETLTVTPKVTVHNYGVVGLVGVDTKSPVVTSGAAD